MSSRSDPYSLLGTTFREKYATEAFVGVGRYAAVYRAVDTTTNERVALRLLKVKDTLTPSRRTIVVEHLRALMRPISDIARRFILFSDVLEVAALVTSAGRWMPVLVQTWMDGETLEGVLDRERRASMEPRSLARAIDLLTPVADALGYAHARGFAHGSVAPRNLFVRDAYREGFRAAGVGDLGIVHAFTQVQDRSRAFAEAPDGPMYFFAATHGSPESFANDRAPARPTSDVFALALVVVELVTGAPALGDGDDARLAAAAADPLRRPSELVRRLKLGRFVETVLDRALAVDPVERYATASAFWEALRSASRMMLRPSSGASVIPPAVPPALVRRETPVPRVVATQLPPALARPAQAMATESPRAIATPVPQAISFDLDLDFERDDETPEPHVLAFVSETPPTLARDTASMHRRFQSGFLRSVEVEEPPRSSRRGDRVTPPPGFFESEPPESGQTQNPLFAGEPRPRAQAEE